MLNHEQNIKHDAENSQSQLGRVSQHGPKVVVVDADEDHLEDGEPAPCEVKQDAFNAPAICTLSS